MASLHTVVALLAVLSSGLCEEKTFLQRAGSAYNSRQYRSLLTVNNGEQFGNWTWPEMCPNEFFAVGFSIRVKTRTHSHITDIYISTTRLQQGEERRAGNTSFYQVTRLKFTSNILKMTHHDLILICCRLVSKVGISLKHFQDADHAILVSK